MHSIIQEQSCVESGSLVLAMFKNRKQDPNMPRTQRTPYLAKSILSLRNNKGSLFSAHTFSLHIIYIVMLYV